MINQKPQIRSFLFLMVSFFLFFSCKKAEQSIKAGELLKGKWELRTSNNGLSGEIQNYASGNGNILTFDGARYEIYLEGKLLKKGVYQLIREESTLTKKMVTKIVYDNQPNSMKCVIDVSDGKLMYGIDAFDGTASVYERM
jgi:hypothetical protein